MEDESKHDPRARAGRKTDNGIPKVFPHEGSKFKKTIGIVSGKGGVGKSMVTSLLAVSLLGKGKDVAILDADVTGPSIPQAFGLNGYQVGGDDNGMFPATTPNNIKIMSSNIMLETPTTPIIWKGPMISSFITQIYSQTVFGECDFLLIDMPPGTGDVPLTVFQQIHVDGVIVVATPQELVSMVVEKAVNMCKMMNIPIIGLVENMSYVECPKCGEKISFYGDADPKEIADRYKIRLLDQLPINPKLAELVDKGLIEAYNGKDLENTANIVVSL